MRPFLYWASDVFSSQQRTRLGQWRGSWKRGSPSAATLSEEREEEIRRCFGFKSWPRLDLCCGFFRYIHKSHRCYHLNLLLRTGASWLALRSCALVLYILSIIIDIPDAYNPRLRICQETKIGKKNFNVKAKPHILTLSIALTGLVSRFCVENFDPVSHIVYVRVSKGSNVCRLIPQQSIEHGLLKLSALGFPQVQL